MNNFFIAQTFGKSSNYTDIPNHLFKEHNVKKGLRNEDGTGVRVGLTRVSDVVGYEIQDGKKVNVPGKLFYRGIEIGDLVKGKGNARYGFEETTFLLLFGYLPSKKELNEFSGILRHFYPLPDEFLEKNLLRSPSRNLMNSLQQSILSLYNYDEDPDNVDPYQTLLKGISILAKLPSMAAYAYQSKIHYYDRESLIIHYPKEEYSIAENILYMLRRDGTFTEQEVCNICSNPRRQENGQICVVESPADIYAIEQTGQFSGRYFVLMGHLSPLDGIGPDDIGLDRLEQRLESETIKEVILATNPTVEGEATANYIAELCAQYGVDASRIAHGVPVGGELEMVDGTTLSHSLAGRHKIIF